MLMGQATLGTRMSSQPEAPVPALGFASLTRFYDPLISWMLREATFKPALVQQAAIEEGHRVLDLGCGTGTLTLMIEREHPEASLVGLDADPAILSIAREKASRSGSGSASGIEWMLGSAVELPFEKDSFDRVVSSLVFHHLDPEQKQAALSEVHRILRSDGQLHVADWGRPHDPLMRATFSLVQAVDGVSNTRDHVEGRLPQIVAEAGFRGVEIRGRYRTVLGSLGLYAAHPSFP